MGGKLSNSNAPSLNGFSNKRGDVKSDSYRYLRTTVDRNISKEKAYLTGVAVLNHCFDDVEKFCARLQHVASAAKELDHRRKCSTSKRHNGHQKPDDAILQLRATPPPESEFIDIFQKYKLSVNLLAKLKSRLRDPDAQQLLQYLQIPLSLLVSVSKDRNYSENLPSRAVSPLFTREALQLLNDSFSQYYLDLCQSLGDSWTVSREDWEGYVTPFYPIFYDGWAPDFPNIITSTPIAPIKRRKEITDSL